ncbi:hypothetical protein [Kitasatospora fiedleri]|uniref:hypothetical protein n=1 Tax=Kitasatospora fiedleri TaxID=2991545 RepID=UPI00249AAF5A|nr:hypothetical protein [Kitasatospora fiedleri]
MRLLDLLTGSKSTAPATGRTPRVRGGREREIRKIDADTSRWLRGGGLAPKRGRR